MAGSEKVRIHEILPKTINNNHWLRFSQIMLTKGFSCTRYSGCCGILQVYFEKTVNITLIELFCKKLSKLLFLAKKLDFLMQNVIIIWNFEVLCFL